MFRYIAIAWDEGASQQSAAAGRLGLAVQASECWCAALDRPGLQVHVTGAHQRTNGIHPLHANEGVVLGKLFRRAGQRDTSVQALSHPDATRIARTGGESLVRDFWGRYIAFLSTGPGSVRVLRDPSGALPCFLVQHEEVWIVFSWLEDVLSGPLRLPAPTVNWGGVAGQILFGEVGGRETALEGVCQVAPGEAVDLVPAQPIRSKLLWNAVGIARTASGEPPPDAAALGLREAVRACTQAWAACHDRILLRLSGGVDSSILASCLTRESTPAEVICLNYHSPGSDSDERAYARLAAARAGRVILERPRDAAFRLDSILQLPRTPTPVNHVGRMNARTDARLAAEHGATAMFTGAGGDQLFFEFSSWWPVADYLRKRGLDAGFAAAAMDAARLGRVSVWMAVAAAIGERVRPSSPWRDIHRHLPLVGPAAWSMAAQRTRFVHPALAAIAGIPIGKATQLLSLVHPIPYYDPFERDAAPEAVHPLLSQPLVEMCLQLPTWVLTQGGRGRALARRAFAGDLPEEIARRRSKGGMEEHVQSILTQHIGFARGMLLDGELVRRGLLDRGKVEEALSGRPTTTASHAGRMHVYIGIEAWLRRWPAPGHIA